MSSETVADAIKALRTCIDEAAARDEPDANAACLATADATSGRPSVRTVYVHVKDDVCFFVNARSGKGRQLEWNLQAALCFFWRHMQQQITLEGAVEPLDDETADAVWQTRTRESALGAHASRQHAREGDPAGLDARLHEEKQRFNFTKVEQPEHWYGYRLLPDRIEFWKTGWQRMRIRQVLERDIEGQWHSRDQEP